MKRRSQTRGRRSGGKARSSYAEKQGRARGKDGKVHGRTRYAPTSPLSELHVTDFGHRLARIALPALQASITADREVTRRQMERRAA